MHTIGMLPVGLFQPSSHQSVIVRSPNRIFVFNILTDVVNKSYSDSAASVVSMVPSPLSAGYLDVVEISQKHQ